MNDINSFCAGAGAGVHLEHKKIYYDILQKTMEQLLKYCERDTLAMVKLWQELVRVSK